MQPPTCLMSVLVAAAIGCGGEGAGVVDAGHDPDGGRGDVVDGAVPEPPGALCDSPVALVDTSSPDHVIGDGTPQSCTEEALAAAVADGGIITFSCGGDPFTLTVTAPLVATDDTVIDGGGLITLSGANSTRILMLDSGFDVDTPLLTVQRLTFRDGQSQAGGDDTAVGGGAIYRDGGSLTIIDSTFMNNHAPATGQDVAGGAVYGFGGGAITVAGSVFVGNEASNGGAIGALQSDLTILNTTLSDNAATGSGGNPGDGGTGGAIYQDGVDERTVVCGSQLTDNHAGAIGGALFRVSNTHDGTFAMDRTTVSHNEVADADKSLAGGMYLQGLDITITASTIADNRAGFGGGIWLGQDSTVSMENDTIAGNDAFISHGGGLWLAGEPSGTIVNCTIANNRSSSSEGLAGAIFGAGLTLKNTIIAGQTVGTPYSAISCDAEHGEGGGNLQWPVEHAMGGSDDPDALCSPEIMVADALLGDLGDHGGPTATLVPAAKSPAIGAGHDCPATDQRGQVRAEPCTSGAVEAE